MRNRGLHNFGRLQNERKLHFSATEEFADLLHALEQVFVDDLQRTLADVQCLIEIEFKPLLLAVNNSSLKSFLER